MVSSGNLKFGVELLANKALPPFPPPSLVAIFLEGNFFRAAKKVLFFVARPLHPPPLSNWTTKKIILAASLIVSYLLLNLIPI